MSVTVFANATLVLPDRLLRGDLVAEAGRIANRVWLGERIDSTAFPVRRHGRRSEGMYLAPGFVDLHVHGGDGADFMDGSAEAFRTVCRCHARHGTTSLTPTSTVATGPQYDRFRNLWAHVRRRSWRCPDRRQSLSTARTSHGRAQGCHPDRKPLVPAGERERFTSCTGRCRWSSPWLRKSRTPSGW